MGKAARLGKRVLVVDDAAIGAAAARPGPG